MSGRERFGSAAAERMAAEHPTEVDRTAAEAQADTDDRTAAVVVEPEVCTAVGVEPEVCTAAADTVIAAVEDTAAEAAAADYSFETDSCRFPPSLLPCLHPFCLFLQLFYRVPQKRVRDPSRFLSKILSCCLPLLSPLL